MSFTITEKTDTTPLFNDTCDRYDYLAAAGCGAIAGLVDIFMVGAPTDSKLISWTDEQTDECIMRFAKLCSWSPKAGYEHDVSSAKRYLEKAFKVNYDQATGASTNNLLNMSTKNHHMKSLSHSPSIVGMFFSILDQFRSTSSFISEGRLVTMDTESFELMGNDLISKIFCGMGNWFGHIISDIGGSSGAKGRGSGIVIPFYEFFGLCNFGDFGTFGPNNEYKMTLADLATKAFEEGYDFRFGTAQAIPVTICDLLIRFVWSVRRYFGLKRPLKECIPNDEHTSLRVMLLCGNGTLCLMDGADAYARSGGEWLGFFLRLNIIAWYRLIQLALKEVCIRTGISKQYMWQTEIYKRTNIALSEYLCELSKYDIEQFKSEAERCNEISELIDSSLSEKELNKQLLDIFEKYGLNRPWEGDFDEFMSNDDERLVFM